MLRDALLQVHVLLNTSHIEVAVDGREILHGELFHEIKAEDSTWYISDGMLQICLVKRNRRGAYEGAHPYAQEMAS